MTLVTCRATLAIPCKKLLPERRDYATLFCPKVVEMLNTKSSIRQWTGNSRGMERRSLVKAAVVYYRVLKTTACNVALSRAAIFSICNILREVARLLSSPPFPS